MCWYQVHVNSKPALWSVGTNISSLRWRHCVGGIVLCPQEGRSQQSESLLSFSDQHQADLILRAGLHPIAPWTTELNSSNSHFFDCCVKATPLHRQRILVKSLIECSETTFPAGPQLVALTSFFQPYTFMECSSER